MVKKKKNSFSVEDSELVSIPDEESINIEPYLYDEDNKIQPNRGNGHPDVIGILPVRNVIVYPGTVTPLAIGRKESRSLIEDTSQNDSVIGLLVQKNPDLDSPKFEDLYSIGTTVSVLKVIRMPQGPMHIVVHGISRFKVVQIISTEPYLKARIKYLSANVRMTKRLKALIVNVRQAANRVIALSPNVPEEASVLLENIENPSALADFLAANFYVEIAKKQQLLEELDATKRLEQISLALAQQLEVLELSNKIQGQVRNSIDKSQREYFLQEQLKAIQTELGQKDTFTEELKQIKQS